MWAPLCPAGLSGDKMVRRLLNLTGGYLESYHSVSMGNTAAATPYTYGTAASGSSLDTLLDTKLVILWGHNPTETIFGHSNHFYQKMKQNGTRFIVVDPRYSDTVSSLADQWIPLLPTTDNALMDAMMYVIVTENLHDRDFIQRYTTGFDEDTMPEGVPANESDGLPERRKRWRGENARVGRENHPRACTNNSATGARLRNHQTRCADPGLGTAAS
ncbi:molybdopterin-dependent oxidoreductase [Enterobacter hormaechei]